MVSSLILLTLIAFFCLIVLRAMRKQNETIKKQVMRRKEQKRQSQTKQATALQNDIANWLMALELPQLAEERRRNEVARQLCIVLIGRLVVQPFLGLTCTEVLQPTPAHVDLQTQSDSKASPKI